MRVITIVNNDVREPYDDHTNPHHIGGKKNEQRARDQSEGSGADPGRGPQDAGCRRRRGHFWTETANKVTTQLPDFAKGYEIPGLAEFTKQFPTAAEVIDSYFDFAQQILTSQREFAHRIVAATKRAAE